MSGSEATVKAKYAPRCWESHPVLKLGNGHVVGGSCTEPPPDCDIYVGLSHNMHNHPEAYPWEKNRPVVIHYPIQDYHVPTNAETFKKMVAWLCLQLNAGKCIHIGCMGGHGRTGMLISAIVAMQGEPDAITWVRNNYCKKVVESKAQVDFLVKHFGVKATHHAKQITSSPAKGKSYTVGGDGTVNFGQGDWWPETTYTDPGTRTYKPLAADAKCLWKKK